MKPTRMNDPHARCARCPQWGRVSTLGRPGGTDIRRSIALVSMAFACALVAGCTVGPNYVKPAVDSPLAWRIDYTQAADVANTRWWEQFDDPVLTSLIETSLKENRDLLIAAARVDAFL